MDILCGSFDLILAFNAVRMIVVRLVCRNNPRAFVVSKILLVRTRRSVPERVSSENTRRLVMPKLAYVTECARTLAIDEILKL